MTARATRVRVTAMLMTMSALSIGWSSATSGTSGTAARDVTRDPRMAASVSASRPQPQPQPQSQSQSQSQPPLTIAMTARAVQPGEVVRLDITLAASDGSASRPPNAAASAKPAITAAPSASPTTLTARAFDRDLPIIPLGPDRWRLLVGIDLDVVAGPHIVRLEAREAGGRRSAQDYVLTVAAKTFPVRRLRVDPRFVEPPAAARPRIERERVRLAAVFAASSPTALWRGPFVLPIDTKVISNFGARSVFNGVARQPHGGADLAAVTGTPIAAPNAGRVVLAADLYFTGNTVVVDHGAGLFSLMAHLSRIDVREGATVARGARLGAVGATGRVTGPHLHWTMRLDAARVDPISLIGALADVADATSVDSAAR